jgi:serine/threonine protein kinase
MANYQDARTCGKCEKAFGVLTLHKHACAACGKGYCRNCSNHFLILSQADIEGFASWDAIKVPTKPQRCCDFCFDRINTRKKGGEAVTPVANTVHSKYAFGKKLGEGGFAEVFEARNKLDGNSVAIKCIKREAMDKEDIEAIFQEVRILESLTHPNIVHLFEFFEEPTHYYMVMEIISGGELFDRIVAKTFYNEKEARDLVVILLRALKYMHDRDVIHRDLKPENLLLTSPSDDADIKIVDFGFAIEIEGLNCTSQVGTPGYIAPEILNKIPYGRPADMWSFGVILYILLGGYPPFHDENQTRLFKKIKNADYVFHTEYWGEISEEAKDLIRRLLTVDMHQRLTVEQALAHPWVNAADEQLTAKNLDANLQALKKYQKTKKWRTGVKAIMAVNRMKTLLSTSPRANSVDIPHVLDARYTLGKKLGEGGYAVVKEGVSKIDGSSYAIKILNRKKMDKKHEDGLRHEVKIMMDLNHPNIVKAYDLFEEPESFYVVMELITGGELFDRIVRKTCYKEAEARQLARTLLGAIKYMHDNNIVHRDLKPENLLLTSEKNDFDIKVVDFGFATEVDGDNLRAHCGTPGYIAPEILKDLPYGKSVDMWSFGVILYILLGGYPPFYDKNQQLLFRKIMKGAYVFHPEYWQEVSDEGKDLIRKLLVVDVPSRLTVEQALAHPWFAGEEELLQKRVLTYGLSELRKFTARRKLRAGIRSVLALKRMQTLASASLRERQMEMALSSIGESSVEEEDDPKSSEVAAAEPVKG